MFIDRLHNGVHDWQKIKEKIDKHGQNVWVYKCKNCGVLGRQFSMGIYSDRLLTLYNKCRNEDKTGIN